MTPAQIDGLYADWAARRGYGGAGGGAVATGSGLASYGSHGLPDHSVHEVISGLESLNNVVRFAANAVHDIFGNDLAENVMRLASVADGLQTLKDLAENSNEPGVAGVALAAASAIGAADSLAHRFEGIADGNIFDFVGGLIDVGTITVSVASLLRVVATSAAAQAFIAAGGIVLTGLEFMFDSENAARSSAAEVAIA